MMCKIHSFAGPCTAYYAAWDQSGAHYGHGNHIPVTVTQHRCETTTSDAHSYPKLHACVCTNAYENYVHNMTRFVRNRDQFHSDMKAKYFAFMCTRPWQWVGALRDCNHQHSNVCFCHSTAPNEVIVFVATSISTCWKGHIAVNVSV